MTDDGKPCDVWIESTRGPGQAPVCLVTIGPYQCYPPVADVRQVALDLVTCAAYAEMMLELAVGRAKITAEVVAQFVTDLLARQDRKFFGVRQVLTMLPAASTRRREAAVILHRGTWDGMLSAVEAREMALHWLAAAEATESDRLVSDALDAAGINSDRQAMLFAYLSAQRSDTPGMPGE